MDEEPKLYDLIYAIVRQVPRGKVASYGQIARIAGGVQRKWWVLPCQP